MRLTIREHSRIDPAPFSLNGEAPLQLLLQRLLQFSFFNLFLVSCLGVLLRAYPFLDGVPLQYRNVLHGHSHFAFGGWVMPVLLALILKSFPSLAQAVAFRHWRNITVLLLASAYGMLVSFPVQGYQAVSIVFSTLSVAAGFYMAIMLWRAAEKESRPASIRFLRAGLFYLVLSAIGPFATGPLIALGKAGTPVYFNAIYFYLHFQYNGWFTFAVLSLLYRFLEAHGKEGNGITVFRLMHLSCLPAFFLSVLWNKPSPVFYAIGGAAALLQVVALFYLLKDTRHIRWAGRRTSPLFRWALAAFIIKNVLQLLSAVPYLASLAAAYRNFVIAYLHLVLLGFVSPFCFAAVLHLWRIGKNVCVKAGMALFLFSFITTEALLAGNELGKLLHFKWPFYAELLLLFSAHFPLGFYLLFQGIARRNQP